MISLDIHFCAFVWLFLVYYSNPILKTHHTWVMFLASQITLYYLECSSLLFAHWSSLFYSGLSFKATCCRSSSLVKIIYWFHLTSLCWTCIITFIMWTSMWRLFPISLWTGRGRKVIYHTYLCTPSQWWACKVTSIFWFWSVESE